MKSIVVLSLLVLTIASVDSAFVPTVPGLSDDIINKDSSEDDCLPNESFRECGHAAICDGTCENMGEPIYTCPPICVRRCICDTGFVRNGNGECIYLNECPIESYF